jgi:hypothetical protein
MLHVTSSGRLLIGGALHTAQASAAVWLAEQASGCPATVANVGPGCAGTQLTTTLPWLGSAWQARATGLPPQALALVTLGTQAAMLPLPTLLATGVAGCTLHLQPDVVDFVLAANGTAEQTLLLPVAASLVGITFRYQMLPVALDPSLAVTATPAVAFTTGLW